MISALRLIRRYGRRGYSCKVPKYPDQPCDPMDPMCHNVPAGKCEATMRVLREKYQVKEQPEQEQEPKCCVLRLAHANPCWVPKRPKKIKTPREPFRSMWQVPCKTDEQPFCKDLLPRFDAIYYHPSNKCRCCQRTWQECPPVKQRLKKVCCLDGIEPPEVQYRIKERCPKLCGVDYEKLRALCEDVEDLRDPNKKCPKIYWPCCQKLSRCNPSCLVRRSPAPCAKLRAPYPSYSEQRRTSRPIPCVECRCLDKLPACVLLREAMRREVFNLRPF